LINGVDLRRQANRRHACFVFIVRDRFVIFQRGPSRPVARRRKKSLRRPSNAAKQ